MEQLRCVFAFNVGYLVQEPAVLCRAGFTTAKKCADIREDVESTARFIAESISAGSMPSRRVKYNQHLRTHSSLVQRRPYS